MYIGDSSPVSRTACWQSTLLQTTDTFTRVVRRIDKSHTTVNVSDLTFIWRWRQSVRRENTTADNTEDFLRRPRDSSQPCFWRQTKSILSIFLKYGLFLSPTRWFLFLHLTRVSAQSRHKIKIET